ncbi:hypothetical protein [Streptomyces zaomyceticus]|uniref:hypothetical protein n=1 Tax=Streptomyces zaomyceticus TaxID=68286 RepID=UPI0036879C8F
MLHYLASSLPLHVSPVARLLALQIVLRATVSGGIHLPAGLVQGMGEDSVESAWQELVDARLIVSDPRSGVAYGGWLADPIGGMPSRNRRRRAADWALRAARQGRVRGLGSTGRVLAVGLRALTPYEAEPDGLASSTDMARIFGVGAATTAYELERLMEVGVLSGWKVDSESGETVWRLA